MTGEPHGSVTEHARKYWRYEYDVSSRYMAPLLERSGIRLAGAELIDVGCGEGGGVCAMHDAGARCVGFDVDAQRIAAAVELRGDRAIPLTVGNLYERPLPFEERQFDIVVLHDVFEHLEEKGRVLAALRAFLKPEGILLITFPPYFSAYGAHQQHCITPWARLPFVHLLPFMVSRILPSLKGEYPSVIAEVEKLHRQKMGMKAFEEIARKGGLHIHRKQTYLISPNHIRFGLRPVSAGPIGRIPIVGEVLCTGVAYLLAREQ